MADLPTLADRVNDVEVSANAPITEALHRKYGSNINFLLDFLGVTDGETSPSGSLNDLAQAVETAANHTMDSQLVIANGAGNAVRTIGTFTQQRFLNQVFYLDITNSTGLAFNTNITVTNDTLRLGIDAGSVIGRNIPTSVQPPDGLGEQWTYTSTFEAGVYAAQNQYSKTFYPGGFVVSMTGTPSPQRFLAPLGVVDWRDGGTNFTISCELDAVLGNYDNYTIYRQYVLNVGSLGY